MHFLKPMKYLLTSLGVLLLNGCHNPYALNIAEINYDAKQTQGVIQITDAKLYSREVIFPHFSGHPVKRISAQTVLGFDSQ